MRPTDGNMPDFRKRKYPPGGRVNPERSNVASLADSSSKSSGKVPGPRPDVVSTGAATLDEIFEKDGDAGAGRLVRERTAYLAPSYPPLTTGTLRFPRPKRKRDDVTGFPRRGIAPFYF